MVPFLHRLVVVALTLALCPFSVFATRFDIKDAGLRNLFYLVNDAPLEKMIGLSNALDGWIDLNPQKIRDGVKGQFVIDLRTLETGNEIRNEFVKEKLLQTSEFPVLNFEFSKLSHSTSDVLKKDLPAVVKVEGQMRLRGQVRPMALFLRLSYLPESEMTRARLPGNLLKVSTSFDLEISDFGLGVVDALTPRVARQLQLAVDAMATDVNQTSLVLPIPEGPKPKDGQVRVNGRLRAPSSDETQ